MSPERFRQVEELYHAARPRSPEERAAFAELLALPDPLLAGYLLGGEVPPEPRLARLVARISALCRLDDGSALFCR